MAVKQLSVHLEHVRSFAEPRSVPVRPLTLLVGENSSGKSTFLAVAACVLDRARFLFRPGINEPPFNLGTFDTIATFKGGKYGRDDSFTIGFTTGAEGSQRYQDVKATYRRDRGGPGLMRFEARSDRGRVTLLAPNGFSGLNC
jgi:hypothetical protein